jgi:hypothetical protein
MLDKTWHRGIAGLTVLAIAALAALAYAGGGAQPQTTEAMTVTVYKSPTCGCCTAWEDHLRESGFAVESRPVDNVNEIKQRHGLPPQLASCHTAIVDGYVVEGHVPADVLQRFLTERPAGVVGLAVPGMPLGSPGMEMPDGRKDPYSVMAFGASGKAWVYSQH